MVISMLVVLSAAMVSLSPETNRDKTGTSARETCSANEKALENQGFSGAGSFTAERAGFEPAVGFHLRRFSRPMHSTALPPLRRCQVIVDELARHQCDTGHELAVRFQYAKRETLHRHIESIAKLDEISLSHVTVVIDIEDRARAVVVGIAECDVINLVYDAVAIRVAKESKEFVGGGVTDQNIVVTDRAVTITVEVAAVDLAGQCLQRVTTIGQRSAFDKAACECQNHIVISNNNG